MSRSSQSAPPFPHSRRTVERTGASRTHSRWTDDLDLAVAVDLVMLHRRLPVDEAQDLLRAHAVATGRDLHQVASDVIDLGTSRLPR